MIKKVLRKLLKLVFRLQLKAVKSKDFTIISSNCTGSMFYKNMGLPYNTPTIDLFFYAPCFVSFSSDIDYYLSADLVKIEESKYEEGNRNRKLNGMYPIGCIEDVEIHFLHYESWELALDSWERRKKRVNKNRLLFMMTDKDLCTDELASQYLEQGGRRVLFGSNREGRELGVGYVFLRRYKGKEEVGNLFKDYDSLLGRFNLKKYVD